MKIRDETKILYEISLSIDVGLRLDQLLHEAVSALVDRLGCSSARVLQGTVDDESGKLHWRTAFSFPSPPCRSQRMVRVSGGVRLPSRSGDWPGFSEQLPLGVQEDGQAIHVFDLPGFGVAVLERDGQLFGASMLLSLKTLFAKLARACLVAVKYRRAENTARQVEADHRSFLENAVVGIYRSTPDGRYLVANPFMAELLGYESPQEMMAAIVHIGRQQ